MHANADVAEESEAAHVRRDSAASAGRVGVVCLRAGVPALVKQANDISWLVKPLHDDICAPALNRQLHIIGDWTSLYGSFSLRAGPAARCKPAGLCM
jgi:hypothetical protein